jgi:hypothetical protein
MFTRKPSNRIAFTHVVLRCRAGRERIAARFRSLLEAAGFCQRMNATTKTTGCTYRIDLA